MIKNALLKIAHKIYFIYKKKIYIIYNNLIVIFFYLILFIKDYNYLYSTYQFNFEYKVL